MNAENESDNTSKIPFPSTSYDLNSTNIWLLVLEIIFLCQRLVSKYNSGPLSGPVRLEITVEFPSTVKS